jgi:primary-amine oxidase
VSATEKPTEAVIHPLEPLSAEEIRATVDILRTERNLEDTYRFVAVVLHEPPKEQVLNLWDEGSIDREALVVLLDNADGSAYEAVVSLTNETVGSWKHIPDVQPQIMLDEMREAEEAIKADPRFREALEKRGITDVDLVMVDPWSAGHYGDEEGRRLLRALSWVRSGPMDNGYAHPIKNVVAVFDLSEMEILRIEDHGVVPIPKELGNYTPDAVGEMRTDLKPVEITQPEGVSFEVSRHEVRWQKWRFRIGFTPQEGLVLYTVGYEDNGKVRPILYRASLSEMVVPYGDASPVHSRKNAFDAGEYNIGQLANSLELGCDCLGEIHYFDAHMVNSRGEPWTIKNAVCMHEEDFGLLWKHYDVHTENTEVRRQRRLVVSFIATVGNYEYGFYWYFYLDGTIELEVKLTGILSTGVVHPGERPEYGQLLNADGLYAPIHQHFFNVRLDMNVDGPNNSVYEVHTESAPPGPENPLGTAFYAKSTLLKTEFEAQRIVDPLSARYWKVVNPSVRNGVNEPVGYKLDPGTNVLPFSQAEASFSHRAGFAAQHLWVTPYDPDERHAAGDYPNQHPGGDGLPRWMKADRSIEDTDVVLWYTFGSHHNVRLEDWPVMPVQHIGFKLQPVGFFDRNPALDVPPPSSDGHCDLGGNGHGSHED